MWIGGVYLNDYVDDIPVAVCDQDNSAISRTIIQYFADDERYTLVHSVSGREELENLLRDGEVYAGLYIPPAFGRDIASGKSSEVLIVIDGTNVIIGNNVYAQAASIIQTMSAGVQIKILQAKGALPEQAKNMALSFNFNERMLYDPKLSYMNYLIFGFVSVFIQQVMLSAMGTLLLRNSEETAQSHTVLNIFTKIAACIIFLSISATTAVMLLNKLYGVAIRGSAGTAYLIAVLFVVAISCPAVFLSALTKDKLKYSQISYMLSLPTFITAGYIWPQDQMPTALTMGIKAVWPLINYARPFDEILFKGVPFQTVLGNICGLVIYTVLWMPVAVIFYKSRFKKEILPE
jgi:ABC-2 type transport system permease protein